MSDTVIHILTISGKASRPLRFTFPFSYLPHPWAQQAAEETMSAVRTYMAQHPESELHTQGKMFGVLVAEDAEGQTVYLRAYSAMLDGSYCHEGFVPPVFDLLNPDGYFKQEEARISAINKQLKELVDGRPSSCADGETAEDMQIRQLKSERKQRSQALQRWMFSQYRMLNADGQTKDLLEIFRNEKPILTEEEYFRRQSSKKTEEPTPPSGAGECCAPKLLQTAFSMGLTPLCMAEFWMGASPQKELRIEGNYYPACQSRCKPILRHMLQGITIDPDPLFRSNRALAEQTETLFEDEQILVVCKPSGLLTSTGGADAFSLQQYTGATPVHRLDMDTSGIVVLAKTKEAYTRLQQCFLRRDIYKRYEALLGNYSGPDEGTVALPILPDPFDRPRQRVDHRHGKEAITDYRIRERRADGQVLVDFFPHTGRTHQLRVHNAHPEGLGAPILGDRLYGDARTAPRLMLHAAELRFPHPITGEILQFVSPSGF